MVRSDDSCRVISDAALQSPSCLIDPSAVAFWRGSAVIVIAAEYTSDATDATTPRPPSSRTAAISQMPRPLRKRKLDMLLDRFTLFSLLSRLTSEYA